MRLALFQPDIPQNTGTLLRMAACLGLRVDIIAPTGFDLCDRALKRAGLDYLERTTFDLHQDFEHFLHNQVRKHDRRLIVSSTRGTVSYLDHHYSDKDILLMGRESAGVPDYVQEAATQIVKIPMHHGNRSLNMAVAAAIIMGEALRQTNGFQTDQPKIRE